VKPLPRCDLLAATPSSPSFKRFPFS
jgi:hypothetical protein